MSRYRRRYCSPIWEEINGYFIPEDWTRIQFSGSVLKTIQRIQENLLDKSIPVFVRGSLIEECSPHPKSDVDLLYYAPQTSPPLFHTTLYSSVSRPLDINAYHFDALEPRRYLLPLMHIRSLQISGESFIRREIEISDGFIDDLWEQYRVPYMPSVVTVQGVRRVMLLKQLFRALGLLSLRNGDGFTRDIQTCLEWLHKVYPKLAHYSEELWAQRTSRVPLDIEPVKDWILTQ